ncbi:hypothetical protein HQ584_01725 [Patescibacteria group bacterium]|nr:hypothetical protein [Patescibacteria group bacterium]
MRKKAEEILEERNHDTILELVETLRMAQGYLEFGSYVYDRVTTVLEKYDR